MAALTGTTPDGAAATLDRLSAAHLVEEHADGRYTFRDLLRAHAADRAAEEDAEPERVAALARLFDWYRHTVDAAARLLYPEILRLTAADPGPVAFTSSTAALAWLDAERPNLVAAVVHGTPGVGWTLSDLLRGAHSRSVARPATAGTRRTA